jgi:hypothetical protein
MWNVRQAGRRRVTNLKRLSTGRRRHGDYMKLYRLLSETYNDKESRGDCGLQEGKRIMFFALSSAAYMPCVLLPILYISSLWSV